MPPPGVRFIRDNGNGTSQWQGPGGAVVDVHHERPDMADFAPPQQQIAQNGPQASFAAPVGTQAPEAAQSTMSDYQVAAAANNQARRVQSSMPSEVQSPYAPPMSVDPNSNPTNSSVGTGAIMSSPDDEAEVARQRAEFEAANPPASVTFAQGGADGAAASGPINNSAGIFFRPGRAGHREMLTRGVSTTTQQGVPGVDAMADQLQDSTRVAEQAMRNNGSIDMLAQRGIADVYGREMDRQSGAAADSDRRRAQGVDAQRDAQRSFEDATRGATAMVVDPDRRSGGDRVIGAIASLLGGIGSGITGGPNHAVQIIQQAIERDVDSQRSNIANKRQGAQDLRSVYQMALQNGASEEEAAQAHEQFETNAAINELRRLAALTESAQAKNDAEIAIAALQGPVLERAANLRALGQDRVSQTVQQAPGTVGSRSASMQYMYRNPTTGQRNLVDAEQVLGDHGLYAGVPAAERAERARLDGFEINGSLQGAASAELSNGDANRSVAFAENLEAIDQSLAAIQRIRQANQSGAFGTGNIGSAVNAVTGGRGVSNAAEQAYADEENVIALYSLALNGLRATDQDVTRSRRIVGALTGRGDDVENQNLNRTERQLRERRAAIIRAQNPAVVQHNQVQATPSAPSTPTTFQRGR